MENKRTGGGECRAGNQTEFGKGLPGKGVLVGEGPFSAQRLVLRDWNLGEMFGNWKGSGKRGGCQGEIRIDSTGRERSRKGRVGWGGRGGPSDVGWSVSFPRPRSESGATGGSASSSCGSPLAVASATSRRLERRRRPEPRTRSRRGPPSGRSRQQSVAAKSATPYGRRRGAAKPKTRPRRRARRRTSRQARRGPWRRRRRRRGRRR